MTIKDKRKRKIVARSIFCLILTLSIFLSSFGISFAYSEGTLTTPDDLIESTPTIISPTNPNYGPTNAQNNLANITNETARVVTMIRESVEDDFYLTTVTSYNELIVIPKNINGYTWGVYSRTSHDKINICRYGRYFGNAISSFYCGTNPFSINGFSGDWYRNADDSLLERLLRYNGTYYCNANIVIIQGNNDYFLASENLNVTAYLPQPEYIFNAEYNEQLENIRCEVNFNPRVYSSFVTVWGYNELGSILYIYGSDEYNIWFGDEQDTEPETYFFYLDINAIFSAYVGTDFHISSISCMGWEDAHEEFLSVNWDFSSEKEPGEYNPPDNNYYYSTYYNENYHYAEQNGNVVAFGNVDICLYSNQNLDRVFWDKQQTLLTPYKYSYVFLPASITNTIGVSYYDLLDELVLEFDIVVNNCPTAVFDAMYGQGAEADFLNQTSVGGLIRWFNTHFRYYDLIPYEYFDNLPSENYQSYDCTCFYTDSFYFKSLSYLLGDSNERLLEFESRLLGEDGAWQVLLSALKSIYDTNFEYQTDMLTYMSKLNYLTELIIRRDYFEQYLFHLDSIDDKLSDIKNALISTDEEDFDNDLHAPWLEIYRYFKNLFNRSLIKLPDFVDTASEILDGGSDQVGIGFTLDSDYEQALPLNSPSISPTPIPIPTLFP